MRCLPLEIPDAIEIDVRNLDLHGTVYVRDLVMQTGVEAADDAGALILSIVEKVEVVVAPVPGAAAEATTAEPELIAKAPKKDDATGEAAPAAGAKDKKPDAKKPDAKKPEKK